MNRIGVFGLAVMGANLARNLASRGIAVAVYNRTTAVSEELMAQHGAGTTMSAYAELHAFVASLERPRRIIVMVKAGAPVDAVLDQLAALLDQGDMVVDGGNSLYEDTQRRAGSYAAKGLHFVGMGVSGGEEGALKGPSLMPGGPPAAFDALEPLLRTIAAVSASGPCVAWCGHGGAGHFVKMVHNGIEYGDMQMLGEVYDLLKNGLGLGAAAIADVFAKWNQGPLGSYLLELAAQIANFADDLGSGKPLVDLILDAAGQKGTGRWTTEAALKLGVPIPTITAAVDARLMSAAHGLRQRIAPALGGLNQPLPLDDAERAECVQSLHDALLAARTLTYAQGFHLLRAASTEYKFEIPLAEMARIWTGGCIIRAKLLDEIRAALLANPEIEHLLLHEALATSVQARVQGLRDAVSMAAHLGVGVPALAVSLAYADSLRRARLDSAALTQAQRDFFGAHTYNRIDREGVFHTEWQR